MEVDLGSISPIYSRDDMDPNLEYSEDTLRMLIEKWEPTEEDIRRELTDEELKKLCLEVKCRVDAYRWNPVCDYQRALEARGKFKGKTAAEMLRITKKAVNRYFQYIKYDDAVIRKARQKEWLMRKKDNLVALAHWAYKRDRQNETMEEDPIEDDCGGRKDILPDDISKLPTTDTEPEESAESVPDQNTVLPPPSPDAEMVARDLDPLVCELFDNSFDAWSLTFDSDNSNP